MRRRRDVVALTVGAHRVEAERDSRASLDASRALGVSDQPITSLPAGSATCPSIVTGEPRASARTGSSTRLVSESDGRCQRQAQGRPRWDRHLGEPRHRGRGARRRRRNRRGRPRLPPFPSYQRRRIFRRFRAVARRDDERQSTIQAHFITSNLHVIRITSDTIGSRTTKRASKTALIPTLS